MTQSLINKGLEGNYTDDLKAIPTWICAKDFKARPENESGVPRMELARKKSDGEQFLVIYNPETRAFQDRCTCEVYTPGALEIRITEFQ